MRKIFITACFASAIQLSACGGGGGEETSATPAPEPSNELVWGAGSWGQHEFTSN